MFFLRQLRTSLSEHAMLQGAEPVYDSRVRVSGVRTIMFAGGGRGLTGDSGYVWSLVSAVGTGG